MAVCLLCNVEISPGDIVHGEDNTPEAFCTFDHKQRWKSGQRPAPPEILPPSSEEQSPKEEEEHVRTAAPVAKPATPRRAPTRRKRKG